MDNSSSFAENWWNRELESTHHYWLQLVAGGETCVSKRMTHTYKAIWTTKNPNNKRIQMRGSLLFVQNVGSVKINFLQIVFCYLNFK